MPTKQITFSALGLEMKKVFSSIVTEAKLAVVDTGNLGEMEMKDYIKNKTHRQRKAGKKSLRDYIKSYYSLSLGKSGFEYGIGSISLLNSRAPYWNRIENGFLPPSSAGFWKDKGGRTAYLSSDRPANFGKQIFYPSNSFPRMVPKKAYAGMKYIYHTYIYLIGVLDREMLNRLNKIKI